MEQVRAAIAHWPLVAWPAVGLVLAGVAMLLDSALEALIWMLPNALFEVDIHAERCDPSASLNYLQIGPAGVAIKQMTANGVRPWFAFDLPDRVYFFAARRAWRLRRAMWVVQGTGTIYVERIQDLLAFAAEVPGAWMDDLLRRVRFVYGPSLAAGAALMADPARPYLGGEGRALLAQRFEGAEQAEGDLDAVLGIAARRYPCREPAKCSRCAPKGGRRSRSPLPRPPQ